jgi:hypothetical protein
MCSAALEADESLQSRNSCQAEWSKGQIAASCFFKTRSQIVARSIGL